jgi:transposase
MAKTPTGSENASSGGRARANIRRKSNCNNLICFSPDLYRAHNLRRAFFDKIKQCRRVATCYDKLAANHLAFIHPASTRLGDASNEPAP